MDLAIKGKKTAYETPIQLQSALNEELPLPYFFDVIDYQALDNQELIDHIDRVGIELYKKPAPRTNS